MLVLWGRTGRTSNFATMCYYHGDRRASNLGGCAFSLGCVQCQTHARGHQKLLRRTPTVLVGVYLRCKDEKNCMLRFAFYYASTPKSIV